MIETRELTKRYGTTLAVADLSFTIQPGRVTGFSARTAPASRRRCASTADPTRNSTIH
jgi:ABC-type phosphonate transport system ATPase subunit